jgi:HEAT repeat protein
LNDKDLNYIVPWSLAEIGDRRAIGPLLKELERDDPSVRVVTISALETLRAREALPQLRELLKDSRKSHFGDLTTVAEAARHAIAVISPLP